MDYKKKVESRYYVVPATDYPKDRNPVLLQMRRDECERLKQEFVRDALQFYGISDYPGASSLMKLAMELGGGMEESDRVLAQILESIKPMLERNRAVPAESAEDRQRPSVVHRLLKAGRGMELWRDIDEGTWRVHIGNIPVARGVPENQVIPKIHDMLDDHGVE